MQAIDFLKWMLNAAEISACIIGFLYWNKIKGSHWKIFPFYLAFIVIAEFAGKYLHYSGHNDLKVSMYNYVVIPLEILFYTWLFYHEFKYASIRRLPIAAACIYTSCWLLETLVFTKKPFWWVYSFSYSVGIILMLVLILTFLYLLATGNEILFVKNNMMFWVCMGLFVFYFCTLPFFGMGNYLFTRYRNIYIGYAYAMYVFNFIMYSLFIISFVWGKPKYSYSSY